MLEKGRKGILSFPVISYIFLSSVHDKQERSCLKPEKSADVMLEMAILINLWQTVESGHQIRPSRHALWLTMDGPKGCYRCATWDQYLRTSGGNSDSVVNDGLNRGNRSERQRVRSMALCLYVLLIGMTSGKRVG